MKYPFILKRFFLFFLIITLFPFITACSSTQSEDEKISIVGNWQNDREVERPPDYFVDLNLEDNGHFIFTVVGNPDRHDDISKKNVINGIYLYDGKVLELKVDDVDNSLDIWMGKPAMFFSYILSDENSILTLNDSGKFLNHLDKPLVLIKVDTNAS